MLHTLDTTHLNSDPDGAALKAGLRMLGEIPVLHAKAILELPLERHRYAEIYSLAGWAAAQITLGKMPSGGRNERLIAALGHDECGLLTSLLERLPGAVLEATNRWQPSEGARKL